MSETSEQNVDSAYRERIDPRVHKKNSPTANIRKWSVLTHGVMELTGPSPFGMDGSVQLWLHERSLTQLLDMCDEVDERFEMLGGGKLTAEQMREIVEKHWHDLPAEYGMPEATALPEYSYDWQAIADELNAALCDGECEMETDREELEHIPYCPEDTWAYKCRTCGWSFRYDRGIKPNFCPNCGKAVKR